MPVLGEASRQWDNRADTTGMCVYTREDKACMESGLAVLCSCDVDSGMPCAPELPHYPEECAIMPVRALHFPLSHSFSYENLKSPCAEQECCDPDGPTRQALSPSPLISSH